MNRRKQERSSKYLYTIRVALLAFSSIAACIDVLPLLLLSPSFGGSFGLGVRSFFLGVGLLTGVAEKKNLLLLCVSNNEITVKSLDDWVFVILCFTLEYISLGHVFISVKPKENELHAL